ncbi:MAG TPA: hypothetical protein VK619_05405 [Pyrinomonadaceae bacterium]|nr:hypothetical protein [Pyrinomonadaceae bacterium]
MSDNQKILIGCGGAGCVGILFIAIAAGVFYFFYARSPLIASGNRNTSTYNSSNSRPNSNNPILVSTMSEDDKHKLFQAAGITSDSELINKVLKKIGLMREDNSLAPDYSDFISAHTPWARRNIAFINQYRSPERARQYVIDHLGD